MSDTDLELLARYARHQAEDAFAEIVRRHLDLVYSAALRQVRSPQIAEEIAQSVFTDLARHAKTLGPNTVLTAWLYQVTRRTAIDAIRREARRQLREQIASEMNATNATADDWTHVEPLLDEAMQALDDTDRTAVLLRYFENKSLREVGQSLGTSDDAAQKRVRRAVERLREFFASRGLTVGASGLVVVISAHAVQAAPVGLAITISATATITGTAFVTTATQAAAMTTLQKLTITTVIAVLAGVGIYEARQAWQWREQTRTAQQQQGSLIEQLTQLKSDNDRLVGQLALAGQSPSLSSDRLRELLRLRGEVGLLRRQVRELEQGLAAQAKASGNAGQPASDRPLPPTSVPFQVQLVMDNAGEDSEPLTNHSAGGNGETVYVQKTPLLDYTAISAATMTNNASSGAPEIEVEFSAIGKELFAAIARENLNKRLAIVLNGHLQSAPVIRSELAGNKVRISGSFTEEEAKEFAGKINEAIRDQ